MTLAELGREVKAQGRLLERLASALLKHTRTDLAPDAALPAMRKLVDEIRHKRRRARARRT